MKSGVRYDWKRMLERDDILGSDTSCSYYPCHFEGQDCTWCFCPFYPCEVERTGGRYVERADGSGMVWSCMYCHWIHRSDVARAVLRELKKLSSLDRESLLKVLHKLLEEYPP